MNIKSFGRDFIVYGVSSSISKFVGIFLVPIYTRIFSPEDYGTMDLVSTTVSLVTLLGILQLESAVSRYYFEEKDEVSRNNMISSALWTCLCLSIVVYILLAFCSNYISTLLFDVNSYAYLLVIAGIGIPIANLNSIFTVVMRFKKKPYHYLFFQLSQITVTISLTVALVVYYRIGIVGVYIGQVTGYSIIALCQAVYLRSHLMVTWHKSVVKKMLRYSIPLVPAVAGTWANTNFNRVVMLGYLSVADIGLYVVALKLASAFQLVGAAFRMAWPPFFWETFENNPDHKKVFISLFNHVSLLLFSLVIILTLYSEEVVMLLTTKQYYPSANLVGLLAFAIAINNILVQITGVGPGITKRTEYNTIIYFLSVAVNVGALFILVPIFGLIGVPISLLLGSLTLLSVGWYNSERLYPIGFEKVRMVILVVLTLGFISLDYWLVIPFAAKASITAILFGYLYKKYQYLLHSLFVMVQRNQTNF